MNKCNSCKELTSFERFYCGAVNYGGIETRGLSRVELNKNNLCPYYERTWWKKMW